VQQPLFPYRVYDDKYRTLSWRKDHPMPEAFDPQIIAFCCKYCAYAAGDLAGSMRLNYAPNVKIVQVPCSGRVDAVHLLRAVEKGADAVYVAG
jgi:hypothetical protein